MEPPTARENTAVLEAGEEGLAGRGGGATGTVRDRCSLPAVLETEIDNPPAVLEAGVEEPLRCWKLARKSRQLS